MLWNLQNILTKKDQVLNVEHLFESLTLNVMHLTGLVKYFALVLKIHYITIEKIFIFSLQRHHGIHIGENLKKKILMFLR